MKKAVIIGASSGIGRALARVLSKEGYCLGLAARRMHLLESLAAELPGGATLREIDLKKQQEAIEALEGLLEEMNGADLLIISSGTGFINPELDWEMEKETAEVNVLGFAAMAGAAFRHFQKRGSGHLVGISSISAIRGSAEGPAYNASKAFVSSYLQGLRQKAAKLRIPVIVTDIQPGLVDTAMAKGEGLFWVQPPDKVAMQIWDAIRKEKTHAYVTKRWRLVAWALKVMPEALYNRL
ncbi:MAG: SDR family NAD(P)-dependent oxidoreductase [Desulfobacteraceae bacterium]|nr:SDR family NAD(P)-dependent oxidoreductase [Desulfobacteraceae bacterium]